MKFCNSLIMQTLVFALYFVTQFFFANKIRHEDFGKVFKLISIKNFNHNSQPHFEKTTLENVMKVLIYWHSLDSMIANWTQSVSPLMYIPKYKQMWSLKIVVYSNSRNIQNTLYLHFSRHSELSLLYRKFRNNLIKFCKVSLGKKLDSKKSSDFTKTLSFLKYSSYPKIFMIGRISFHKLTRLERLES